MRADGEQRVEDDHVEGHDRARGRGGRGARRGEHASFHVLWTTPKGCADEHVEVSGDRAPGSSDERVQGGGDHAREEEEPVGGPWGAPELGGPVSCLSLLHERREKRWEQLGER